MRKAIFRLSSTDFPGKQCIINEKTEPTEGTCFNLAADAGVLSKAAVEGKLAAQGGCRKTPRRLPRDRGGHERYPRRGHRPFERGRRIHRQDQQGRYPAQDHGDVQRRFQRDQEQSEPVYRWLGRPRGGERSLAEDGR